MVKKSRRKFIGIILSILGLGGIFAWLSKNTIMRWLIHRTDNMGLAISLAPELSDDIVYLPHLKQKGPFLFRPPSEVI